MEKGENEVYIGEKKCKIEFIKLIGTWPGGSQFVECQYKVIFEREIVRLYLQIVTECPEYEEMGKPSQEEIDNKDFTRSEKGQERFFRGKGKNIVIEALNRVAGIEGIRRLGCNQIPTKIATVVIEDIKERN